MCVWVCVQQKEKWKARARAKKAISAAVQVHAPPFELCAVTRGAPANVCRIVEHTDVSLLLLQGPAAPAQAAGPVPMPPQAPAVLAALVRALHACHACLHAAVG